MEMIRIKYECEVCKREDGVDHECKEDNCCT